jgi:hypothetical protein
LRPAHRAGSKHSNHAFAALFVKQAVLAVESPSPLERLVFQTPKHPNKNQNITMTINTKQYAVWAGLLLCTAVGTYAVPVTFQVDMGQQPGFNPAANSVEVRGPFNGWGGTGLTNVPGTTTYTNTIDITSTAGSWVQYKFFVGYNGTMNWETLGGWHPGGNRAFKVPTVAETLPLAYYADVGPGGTSVAVSFQIDMSAQLGAGFFNPGSGDLIQAMGAFNNSWNAIVLTNDPAASNPNLYSGTYVETTRPPGTLIEYKFAINVGGAGTTLNYESLTAAAYPDSPPNRAFILPTAAMTLPAVYFSDASGYPIKAGVYFQLDLSSQILIGAFDPTNDIASVRGDAMGWGEPPGSGLQLFEDASRPGIYTNTWLMTNQLTGAAFTYKNTFFHPTPPSTVWESGDNKSLTFVGNEPTNAAGYHMITVGPTLFDNFLANTNDYLPADTLVTFSVSMTNAQSYPAFTPPITFNQSMGVAVNGNWIPWWNWAAAAPAQFVLTNGTSGDWIYSQTVLIPKGKPVQLVYKYGMDDGASSLNNEAPDGSDRVRYIRQVGSYTLPLDTFGTQTVETSFGSLTVEPAWAGHVLVSWLGRPGVYLQTTTNLNSATNWVTHLDSAAYGSPSGIYSTNYPTTAKSTFFRLVKP